MAVQTVAIPTHLSISLCTWGATFNLNPMKKTTVIDKITSAKIATLTNVLFMFTMLVNDATDFPIMILPISRSVE